MSTHKKILLKVISKPKPKTRAVLNTRKGMPTPVIKGVDGNVDLHCGKCKTLLVEGVVEGQIQNVVLRCPRCRAYNEIAFPVDRWTPRFPSE